MFVWCSLTAVQALEVEGGVWCGLACSVSLDAFDTLSLKTQWLCKRSGIDSLFNASIVREDLSSVDTATGLKPASHIDVS